MVQSVMLMHWYGLSLQIIYDWVLAYAFGPFAFRHTREWVEFWASWSWCPNASCYPKPKWREWWRLAEYQLYTRPNSNSPICLERKDSANTKGTSSTTSSQKTTLYNHLWALRTGLWPNHWLFGPNRRWGNGQSVHFLRCSTLCQWASWFVLQFRKNQDSAFAKTTSATGRFVFRDSHWLASLQGQCEDLQPEHGNDFFWSHQGDSVQRLCTNCKSARPSE